MTSMTWRHSYLRLRRDGNCPVADEEPEVVVAEIVPMSQTLIQAAPVADVKRMQDEYMALCNSLLDESDYQQIGAKKFRKKSGWRKLAVAFNVSVELLDRREMRGKRNRIESVEIVVRATAPNGRFMDGLGACDIWERCCDKDTCRLQEVWADSGKPTGHVHCNGECDGRHHFSNPSHDIPSTAMTRATNRACADLFGMGEVSAEEVTDSRWTPGETARSDAPLGGQSHQPARGGVKMAQKAQLERINALLGKSTTGVVDIIPHFTSYEDLTLAEARLVIDTLEQRKAGQ